MEAPFSLLVFCEGNPPVTGIEGNHRWPMDSRHKCGTLIFSLFLSWKSLEQTVDWVAWRIMKPLIDASVDKEQSAVTLNTYQIRKFRKPDITQCFVPSNIRYYVNNSWMKVNSSVTYMILQRTHEIIFLSSFFPALGIFFSVYILLDLRLNHFEKNEYHSYYHRMFWEHNASVHGIALCELKSHSGCPFSNMDLIKSQHE